MLGKHYATEWTLVLRTISFDTITNSPCFLSEKQKNKPPMWRRQVSQVYHQRMLVLGDSQVHQLFKILLSLFHSDVRKNNTAIVTDNPKEENCRGWSQPDLLGQNSW